MAFDYSKWDNIEISDDEADCHPNIDKASWFRMKHRSRVEREDTEAADRKSMEAENRADGERESEILRILAEIKAGGEAAEYEDEEALSGELVEEHEAVLEDYLATRDIEQCKGKIHEHGGTLLHEHAQSYILLSCLEDEMNGYHDKMVLSARNSQILSHVTELATSLQRHPRDVVLPFFKRIAEEQYRKGFEEAVAGFASRIENRAVEKRKEMDAAKAAEGGGDDDYESMQEAFEAKDMAMLQVALEAMTPDEAKKHMDACEKSGLWVANKAQADAEAADA
ncbi:hypothetical protein JL720_9827 [Aureococcus anophagefferens]|nr:hypothetical protein JL720_9827 [Aureococcus anophagefferens]